MLFSKVSLSVSFFFIGPPLDKILCQFSLHIVHVQSRGTDGDGREVKVSNWLGCTLQGGHHLCEDEVLNQLLSVELLFSAMKGDEGRVKDVWASYHLVLLPLGPSVPGEGRGKGNECKNNQGPQQPI